MISHLFNSIIQEYKGIGLILNDSPEPWNIGFQDGVSPGYSGIIDLHDNIFFYLVVIAILVFWMLGSTIYYFNNVKSQITHKYLVHGTLIEVLWTIFPAIVLLAIAIPSFRLLYILDEVTLPTITIKVTGHQWYWSYEYSDYETESGEPIEYDSYMKPESDLEVGDYRLLEVDNPIVIPAETHVRFIITSSDVLHDFALPAAGVKMDAAPARLNQTSFEALREGSLFGQCSELCGPYHGFMPIEVKVTSVDEYLTWIDSLGIFLFITNNKIKNKFHFQWNPRIIYCFFPMFQFDPILKNFYLFDFYTIQNLTHFLSVIFISFVLNLFILSLIYLNLFGTTLKNKLDYLIKEKLNSITIFYFIFVFILISCLNFNIIYLEDIIVKTNIDGVEITVSGNALKFLFENFGSTVAFGVGARLAALTLAKNPMAIGSKIAIGISTGAVSFGTHRLIARALPLNSDNTFEATVKIDEAKLLVQGIQKDIPHNRYIDYLFGSHKFENIGFKAINQGNNGIELIGNEYQNSNKILETLNNQYPNWRESFHINSPSEWNHSITGYIVDTLTDELIISICTTQLSIILLLIFICKLILDKNIELKFLKNFYFGDKISYLLIRYIKFWQTSGNIWIIFILILLIVSNGVASYYLYKILEFF